MLAGKRLEIKTHLTRFSEAGKIRFERTLLIPEIERIPALVASYEGRFNVFTAVVASLKYALDNINLRKTFNEDQLLELADVIIDSSHEDQLALEDVLLFLGRLMTGQAGTLYDRLDMPTFFELFETYREERFQALRHVRDEQHANYKCMGDSGRLSDQMKEEDSTYREVVANYYKKHQHEKAERVESEPVQKKG